MEHTTSSKPVDNKATGFFSDPFYRAFRALFKPLTRLLDRLGITPNMVTAASLLFGLVAGIEVARDHLWSGLLWGYLMGFSDIVDGQLAKEYGRTTPFGGILDSTIDRYNEFFLYAGLGARFVLLGEHLWALVCAAVFANSMLISYVKARAEADGYDCNVGRLQRPERLTLVAIAVAFSGLLLKPILAFLAVGTLGTVLRRMYHVKAQAEAMK